MQSGASHADKTLSRSCLVQKRKNFVSRARTTPLRSVVLLAWEAKVSWASFPSRQCRPRAHPGVEPPRHLGLCVPGNHAAYHTVRQHTETGQQDGPSNKSNRSGTVRHGLSETSAEVGCSCPCAGGAAPRPVLVGRFPRTEVGRKRYPDNLCEPPLMWSNFF